MTNLGTRLIPVSSWKEINLVPTQSLYSCPISNIFHQIVGFHCLKKPESPLLTVSLQSHPVSKDIQIFVLSEIHHHFANTNRRNFGNMFAWQQTLWGFLVIFCSLSERTKLHCHKILLPKQAKWFLWSLPGAILAYKLSISVFFVVVPCADVPITAWINKSVLAISRSFVVFHEREIIFDITTVTTVATRLTVLYTARMAATKSFTAFTQFEAVTQTAFWTSCTHVLDLSFRPWERAWCNVIPGLCTGQWIFNALSVVDRRVEVCWSSTGLMLQCYVIKG